MILIQEGDSKVVSIVIGLCKPDYCMMVSDGRMVVFRDGEVNIVTESKTKLFQVNANVIAGFAGIITKEHEFDEPLRYIPDAEHANVLDVTLWVAKYLGEHKYEFATSPGNYIVGGRNAAGQMQMYVVHWDVEQLRASYAECYGPTALLPGGLENPQSYKEQIEQIAYRYHKPERILQGLKKVIADVASENPTVNTNICYRIV